MNSEQNDKGIYAKNDGAVNSGNMQNYFTDDSENTGNLGEGKYSQPQLPIDEIRPKYSNELQVSSKGILSQLEEKLNLFQKRQNSASEQLSWRDPRFVKTTEHERKFQKNNRGNWRSKDTPGGSGSLSFNDAVSNNCKDSNFCSNRRISQRNSLEGFWSLLCENEVIDDYGLTESGNVLNLLNELYQEKPELFTRKPKTMPAFEPNLQYVCCYTENYEDKLQICKVGHFVLEKLSNYYNFPISYRRFQGKKLKSLYMCTLDGDTYEYFEKTGWSLMQL